jgi:hypothetical protein
VRTVERKIRIETPTEGEIIEPSGSAEDFTMLSSSESPSSGISAAAGAFWTLVLSLVLSPSADEFVSFAYGCRYQVSALHHA